MNKKKTFTLIEVVVSSVIVASVFGGLLAAFVSVRAYIRRATIRLTAYNLSRSALNGLYRHVRWDEWADPANPLFSPADGTQTNNPLTNIDPGLVSPLNIDNIEYASSYDVEDFDGGGPGDRQYRQVWMHIVYPTD